MSKRPHWADVIGILRLNSYFPFTPAAFELVSDTAQANVNHEWQGAWLTKTDERAKPVSLCVS